MTRLFPLLLVIVLMGCNVVTEPEVEPSVDFAHGDLQVSENGRFLVHADGTPFFYLGDTCWELFHRMDRKEVEMYLEDRRQKGFTVIQAVALAELDGLNTPNSMGDKPLVDNDPTQPATVPGVNPDDAEAYDYWDHVDYVFDVAEEKGLYIGFLPTWGDKVLKRWGVGPEIFDEANAEIFGAWLAERYKDRPNLIWILGGDRAPEWEGRDFKPVWNAMALAIQALDSRHLMTYHTWGGTSSGQWFHDENWHDFSMLQSGHDRNVPNWEHIQKDYQREPAKPTFDGEPCYEDIPAGFNPQENGWIDDWDMRKAAYRSLFAGGFGFTYGCNDIWQLWKPGRAPVIYARTPWPVALDLPGAKQMIHVRTLMESRPMLQRIPDQSLLVTNSDDPAEHKRATRAEDGSYAFVYLPNGEPVEVDLSLLAGSSIQAWWYNPHNGLSYNAGTHGKEVVTFESPLRGPENDWVLVLDDAAQGFKAPGLLQEG